MPAAVIGVLAASGVGFVVWPQPSPPTPQATSSPPDSRSLGTVDLSARGREAAVSRSADRAAAVRPGKSGVETARVPAVQAHRWTTAELNVWSGPGEDTTLVAEIPAGVKVAVTGTVEDGWAQIVRAGMPRWVNATYLSEDKPDTTGTTGVPATVSYAPCPAGSSVENGLTPDAIRVHRALCAAFPQITAYGGLRPGDGNEHGTGQALDIMTSDQALGDEIAAYLIEHRTELGVSEVLWWQQIWTVQRMSEGWRAFSDRGSDTANHYDHVHATVYGDAGTG